MSGVSRIAVARVQDEGGGMDKLDKEIKKTANGDLSYPGKKKTGK